MESKEARELTKVVAIAVLLGYVSAWIHLGSLPWWMHFIAGMEFEYLGAQLYSSRQRSEKNNREVCVRDVQWSVRHVELRQQPQSLDTPVNRTVT